MSESIVVAGFIIALTVWVIYGIIKLYSEVKKKDD